MWDKCLIKLKKSLPLQDFSWVNMLKAQHKGDALILIAPNSASINHINKKLKNIILQTAREIDEKTTIKFEVVANSGGNKLITSHLNKEFSFDNLVEGNANMFALNAGKQIANNIKKSEYNPFIIFGNSGLGKTHLMQAIGNLALSLNPGLRIVYVSLMDFVRNMTAGLRHKNIEEIKEYYQKAQLLLIDDIHMIVGKEKMQEEFFHIFNFLFHNKKQIIMTCDQIPNSLQDIETRLKTRITNGLNIEIKPPELEMRQAILIDKSQKSKLNLTEEAVLYIASNIDSNVRDLEGALLTIKAFMEFSGTKQNIVDGATAKEALQNIIKTKKFEVDIADIQKQTAKQYGITTTDLISKNRKQNITHARHTAIYLSQKLTNLSLSAIGKNFGNRDHSTIINSCDRFKELRKQKNEVKQQYEMILMLLSTN
jgi:chromosomal replication initiator protein